MKSGCLVLSLALATTACKKHEEPAAGSGSAKAGSPALADHHVNDKFPTKLVVDPAPGVDLSTASFGLDSATVGTLTVPYQLRAPGARKLTGTFKLSVCTEQHCITESPKIAFDVRAE